MVLHSDYFGEVEHASGGGGNDADTMVLLHMDGANESTTFTNSAVGGSETFSVFADAQLATAVKKFGTASGKFDGTGDFIRTDKAAELNPGTGDFAVDFWARVNSTATSQSFFELGSYTDTDNILLLMEDASTLKVFMAATQIMEVTSTTFITDTFYHFALTRDGTDLRYFLNGELKDTQTNSADIQTVNNGLAIGGANFSGSQYVNGYIDEFRYSVGAARWTAPFTPPTSEYTT